MTFCKRRPFIFLVALLSLLHACKIRSAKIGSNLAASDAQECANTDVNDSCLQMSLAKAKTSLKQLAQVYHISVSGPSDIPDARNLALDGDPSIMELINQVQADIKNLRQNGVKAAQAQGAHSEELKAQSDKLDNLDLRFKNLESQIASLTKSGGKLSPQTENDVRNACIAASSTLLNITVIGGVGVNNGTVIINNGTNGIGSGQNMKQSNMLVERRPVCRAQSNLVPESRNDLQIIENFSDGTSKTFKLLTFDTLQLCNSFKTNYFIPKCKIDRCAIYFCQPRSTIIPESENFLNFILGDSNGDFRTEQKDHFDNLRSCLEGLRNYP